RCGEAGDLSDPRAGRTSGAGDSRRTLAGVVTRRRAPRVRAGSTRRARGGGDGSGGRFGVRVLLQADAVYPFFSRPAWSPDGTRLAISRSGGGQAQEIWL